MRPCQCSNCRSARADVYRTTWGDVFGMLAVVILFAIFFVLVVQL